jgi:hypothetical protein
MATSGAIRAGRAFIEVFLDDSLIPRGMRAVAGKLQQFGSTLRAQGLRMMLAGNALAAPLVFAVRTFATYGEQLDIVSRRTGIGVEALSALGYAAKMNRLDMEDLEVALRMMERHAVDARAGLGGAQRAFLMLGLSTQQLAGLAPERLFGLIADRISLLPDPTVRAAAAIQVFGRTGTAVIPMLENGRAGLEAWRLEAERFGLIVSGRDVVAASEFHKAMVRLGEVLRIVRFQVGAALAPALTDLANRISAAARPMMAWIRTHQGVIILVAKVAAGLIGAGLAAVILGTALRGLGTALNILAFGLSVGLRTVHLVIAALGGLAAFLGPVGGAVALFAGYWLVASGKAGQAAKWLGQKFKGLREEAGTSLKAIGQALAAGDLSLAVRIAWLQIQIWWNQGVDAVQDALVRLKNFATGIWEAISAAAEVVRHSLMVGWEEVGAWAERQMARLEALRSKGLPTWVPTDEQLLGGLKGLLSGNLPGGGSPLRNAVKQFEAEQAHAAKAQGAEQTLKDTLGMIERERRATLDAENKRYETRMRNIARESQQEKEAREAARAQEHTAMEKQLIELRGQYGQAITRAREEAEAAVPGLAGKGEAPKKGKPEIPRLEPRILETAALGTFSAAVAGRLGMMGPAERTAAATEKTARNTERIERELREGGLAAEFEP